MKLQGLNNSRHWEVNKILEENRKAKLLLAVMTRHICF